MSSTNLSKGPSKKVIFAVIRPVGDLWLWWALAAIGSYLVSEVIHFLLDNVVVDLLEAAIVSALMVMWILSRYFANLNWQRWLLLNIVGGTLGTIAGVVVGSIGYFIVRQFTHQSKLADNLISLSISLLSLYVIASLVIAIAQWKVFRLYASDNNERLWLAANITAGTLSAIAHITARSLGFEGDSTGIFIAGLISVLLSGIITGLALVRIMQEHEPVMQES
jgi:hypothetical protein